MGASVLGLVMQLHGWASGTLTGRWLAVLQVALPSEWTLERAQGDGLGPEGRWTARHDCIGAAGGSKAC